MESRCCRIASLRGWVVSMLLWLAFKLRTRVYAQQHEMDGAVLQQIHQQIEAAYNLQHGPRYNNFPPNPQDHQRRCMLMLPHQAKMAFLQGFFAKQSRKLPILVSSPCLGVDSLGNYLGNYLENVACAHRLGITYMGVAKVYEPRTKDASNAFLDALPAIIAGISNRSSLSPQADMTSVTASMRAKCPCATACHESDTAAWVTSMEVIRPLLQRALKAVLETVGNETVVAKADMTKQAVGTVLPFVPDVSIHYRCGDNFVGNYGFLPFAAFEKYISKMNISKLNLGKEGSFRPMLIYVYAETRSRKVSHKQHLAQKCDTILRGLYEHLSAIYPRDTVLVRRGDDPYADMARLAFSKLTICSISTFCLWPALASTSEHVYFPVTPIVARGNWAIKLRKGFHWMTSDAAPILGAPHEGLPVNKLMDLLTTGSFASRPTAPLIGKPGM